MTVSDVNISHGNSGGPLFTPDGLVLGITTLGDFSSQGGPARLHSRPVSRR